MLDTQVYQLAVLLKFLVYLLACIFAIVHIGQVCQG